MNRRRFLKQAAILSAALPLSCALPARSKPIPVILGTDIGDDIDDTWALALLLRSPELQPKLIYGDYGKSSYRAKLIAKFLQTVGRTDIPIALGADADPRGDGGLANWIRDYDLKSYPGKILPDAPAAIIDTINKSPEPVTVISIAPAPNLAAALKLDPTISQRARFVGMYGSLRVGYGGSKDISAEWNVKADAKACQTLFRAKWNKTITPLDTCGLITLDGERYRALLDSHDIMAQTVLENYRIWSKASDPHSAAPETHSSTLFDTVAVCLAFNQTFFTMEDLSVTVTDDGFTRIDPQNGDPVHAAVAWKNLDGLRDLLVNRLTGS